MEGMLATEVDLIADVTMKLVRRSLYLLELESDVLHDTLSNWPALDHGNY